MTDQLLTKHTRYAQKQELMRARRETFPVYATVADAATPDMSHSADDVLFWKLWLIQAEYELKAMVNANQYSNFIREMARDGLGIKEQYQHVASQIELEKAHREQDVCSCFGIGDPCPVCQEAADGVDISDWF